MAFMSQEKKKEIQTALKPILKKYKVKGRLGVHHHSTIVLNIVSSPIDFIGNYNSILSHKSCGRPFQEAKNHIDVNHYWYKEQYNGVALEFLEEILLILNNGNYDNSNPMSDYFDVGWYVEVNVGKWDKPYQLIEG